MSGCVEAVIETRTETFPSRLLLPSREMNNWSALGRHAPQMNY